MDGCTRTNGHIDIAVCQKIHQLFDLEDVPIKQNIMPQLCVIPNLTVYDT